MMAGVPYLYVNIAAFCCYILFLAAFLAAKKSQEIRGFILVLIGFAVWSGASVLMRLEIYPGLDFWFYVSLLALFSEGWLVYIFVLNYSHMKQPISVILWSIGTVVILVFSAFGVFLKPPTVNVTEAGKVFTYSMTWTVGIPYVFLMAFVVVIASVFRKLIHKQGNNIPGLRAVILGCVIIGLGNIIQILPGNIFPWDQLSGIIFAILLALGLYKKRMFTMTLLINRRVLSLIALIMSAILLSALIEPVRTLFAQLFPYSDDTITMILVIVFTIIILLFFSLIEKLTSVLFNLENQQSRLVSDFSEKVSKSLDTTEITSALIDSVLAGVAAERAFVCLKDGDDFAIKGDSAELGSRGFRIAGDSPLLSCLQGGEGYLIMDEFRSTTMYRSLWEDEKALLIGMDVACIVPLNEGDEICGLILLTNKEKRTTFTASEVNYLMTISSVASIAVKNAALYEQMYREARVDSLTGVYNYRAFVDAADEYFRKYGNECLALLDIDIDDFKLYNQLYGTLEGDHILRSIAGIIKSCIGENGQVFRTSGKIFSVLLPLCDGRRAQALTEEIRSRVLAINTSPERKGLKTVTISAGICVAPFSASSVSELIDSADLATFTAKDSGKDRIILRQSAVESMRSVKETVHNIIERPDVVFDNNKTIISALTAAIDAKDHYTCQHSNNVAEYAAILAAAYGLGDDEVRLVYHAGLLHDIGKISIPEVILSKSSSLTDEEYEIIKGHVNGSIDMIRHLPAMDYLIPAVVGHHERWDGRGYPRGISGDEIPLTARCLALADTFDAITTDRPYRKGLSVEYAIDQIEKNSGKQFDPVLADCFVRLLKNGTITLKQTD